MGWSVSASVTRSRQRDDVIATMLLSKSEAQELFDAYTATLEPSARAYAERAELGMPNASDSLDVRRAQVAAAASWFMTRLVTGVEERPAPLPVWWDPNAPTAEVLPEAERGRSPFTRWQLELVDQFSAWYWLAVEAALPAAKRVVRKESPKNWRNKEPNLEIAAQRYASPLTLVYVWGLRLLKGQNEDVNYIVEQFNEDLTLGTSDRQREGIASTPDEVRSSGSVDRYGVAAPPVEESRSAGKITKRSERYDGIRETSWHINSDDDLRCVDVVWSSDSEDGRWQVDVAAAEYIRGGELEALLEDTVTRALLGVRGVRSAVREGTESWFVEGTPRGSSLVRSVSKALEPLIPRLAEAVEE